MELLIWKPIERKRQKDISYESPEFNKGYDIDLMYIFCPGYLIRKAHKMGHEVNLWTINRLAIVRHFMYLGVDYITTDCDFSGKI